LVNSDSEFIEKTYEILSNSSLRDKLSTQSINTTKTFSEHNFEKQLSKIF